MKSVSVTLKNISKVFKGFEGQDIRAVDDVSFSVKPGEFVTLLGPSGCGKTTTLRMIAGFETPTKGKIMIGEGDVTFTPPWKRDIAMVFQSYGLFPHMSVGNNVAYGLKMRKMDREKIKKQVSEILELVGLKGFEHRPPSSLSGGQQQRVALARALVVEPSVLLFDEPLSNLDVLLREQMRVEIRRIQKQVGITALYVTHDRTEAMTLSDRIIVMNSGKIMQIGTPNEVYEKPESKFVASFMGKIAFFPVEIKAIMEDRVKVAIKGKELVLNKEIEISENLKYVLGCRPEGLYLEAPGKGHIEGKVLTNVYLGNYVESYVKTEFGEVMVKTEAGVSDGFEEGAAVSVAIKEERAKLIPDTQANS
ncbi:ABC transporter [Kosmotoga arenicorallina S304]|uniref:ABC transporter n=1 Tax=Kosmotoga arenicorallina S304 TaxID=1453497 RepID=A0A176JSX6_9BACT|nr:ABC transporter ATP-binding protein [Kosmotoga arenicorallina]OAA26332.1 ABC transporter [Kosmotoga arenicorallina S304]